MCIKYKCEGIQIIFSLILISAVPCLSVLDMDINRRVHFGALGHMVLSAGQHNFQHVPPLQRLMKI